ncbi:MAG: amidase [Polyangiales bacterium]
MESIGAASGIDPWELSTWDAVETAERIRRREVSAREVIEAALRRADDMQSLNAIVTPTKDRAREAAARSQRGPLFGVPTAIKDLAHVEGVRTAFGSAASGTWIANRSSQVVRAFEDLGLVSIGKSATPELGMTGTTEPIAFGPCRNPHAKDHSTGGSSGGAAALVASRVVPIAHASDGGGSIRIPAACCGLVGLKPSRRRLDMDGSNLLPVNIAVDGVVTRTVRDTVAFWTALERQKRPRGVAPIGHVAKAPPRRLKLAVFVDSPIETAVDAEVRAVVERTAALCVELGHEVRPIRCPFGPQVVHDFLRLWTFVGFVQARAGRLLVHPRFDRRKLEPFTLGFARDFTGNIPATLAAIRRLRGFAARYASIVEPYDALIGPTLAELPPKLGHLATDQDYERTIERLLSFTPFTGLINAAGAPALSLPMGRSEGGLPIGVQLMATHGAERVLLELAGELEAARA